MQQLVSVVITTYCRTTSLQRALQSVLAQTYENLEVIIVDDNSDLALKMKVEKLVYEFRDARIRLIVNASNMGGALARNEGVLEARGKYIAFLDDDDEYLPDQIQKQMALMVTSSPNVALVYGDSEMIGRNGKAYHRDYDFTGNCLYEGMIDCIAATSQWLCRKEALLAVGSFDDVPCKQDSTVIVKLLAAGYELQHIPEILSIYYANEGNRISTQGHEKRVEGEETLRNLCRMHYKKITKKQQREVEYAFSTRLLEHYVGLHMWRNVANCLIIILAMNPLRKASLRAFRDSVKVVV